VERGQPFDDLGVLAGEVPGFGDVFSQVAQEMLFLLQRPPLVL